MSYHRNKPASLFTLMVSFSCAPPYGLRPAPVGGELERSEQDSMSCRSGGGYRRDKQPGNIASSGHSATCVEVE
eukprot:342686-Prymnesium_polylepis.2